MTTPMNVSEVYKALQLNTMEGQENPVFNIIGSRFQEVQKYLILTRHVHDPSPFIISGTAWDSWSEEQRQWVTQASEEAAEYMRAEAAEMENAKIQELQDAGMTVIELTEEERQTFVDAVDGVAEQFRDEMGEEAWELYQTCITEAQG